MELILISQHEKSVTIFLKNLLADIHSFWYTNLIISKSEVRNSKQIQIPKAQNSKQYYLEIRMLNSRKAGRCVTFNNVLKI